MKDNSNFRFHPKCKKLNLTHACFADDLLRFTRGDISLVREMYASFSHFSSVSSLKENINKSSIYFGVVKNHVQQDIIDEFQLTKVSLPFKYLVVPLSSKKLSVLASMQTPNSENS